MAVLKDEKKRQKKVRSELVRILNAVDALAGHLPTRDLDEISRIVKFYLAPIIGSPDLAGHGHEDFGHDRDPATSDGPAIEDESRVPTPIDEEPVTGPQVAVSKASDAEFASKPPAPNPRWYDLPQEERDRRIAAGRDAYFARLRALHEAKRKEQAVAEQASSLTIPDVTTVGPYEKDYGQLTPQTVPDGARTK